MLILRWTKDQVQTSFPCCARMNTSQVDKISTHRETCKKRCLRSASHSFPHQFLRLWGASYGSTKTSANSTGIKRSLRSRLSTKFTRHFSTEAWTPISCGNIPEVPSSLNIKGSTRSATRSTRSTGSTRSRGQYNTDLERSVKHNRWQALRGKAIKAIKAILRLRNLGIESNAASQPTSSTPCRFEIQYVARHAETWPSLWRTRHIMPPGSVNRSEHHDIPALQATQVSCAPSRLIRTKGVHPTGPERRTWKDNGKPPVQTGSHATQLQSHRDQWSSKTRLVRARAR